MHTKTSFMFSCYQSCKAITLNKISIITMPSPSQITSNVIIRSSYF